LALSVPLSRFTSRVGGGSAFFVSPLRTMRVFSVTLLACASILLAGCGDTVERSYPTLATAKQGIEKGWIPSILPVSTVQIQESHDLDANTGHGTFVFGAEDAAQFKSALTPLPADEQIRRVHISRERMERDGYSFYSHGDFYLAVDWSSRRGEFWLASSR